MTTSKDIARKLRLAGYPGRDSFRQHYLAAGFVCMVAGFAVWLLMGSSFGARQYLPRPVSANHALFGDKCESCHDSFRPVSDQACLGCHSFRMHSAVETDTPACAHCHVEHRPTDVFLSVSEGACVACHGGLDTRDREPAIEADITDFASHPEFASVRGEKRKQDPGQLRFNHKVHLTSREISEDERPLECAKCHRLDATGKRMEPIRFAKDCQRCHEQAVEGPTGGSIITLHDTPEKVREDLRLKLLDAAASIGTVTSDELRRQLDKLAVPSPELLFPQNLPGRVERDQFSKERLSVSVLERDLYRAFVKPGTNGTPESASVLSLNKNCFLCHSGKAADDATSLPEITPTAVPAHWMPRAEFSHGEHEQMPCASCHPSIPESRETSEVNLPGKDVCTACHVDGERASAGTVCMQCHVYHDTSRTTVAAADGEKACTEPACVRGRPVLLPARPQNWWSGAEHHAGDLAP